MKKLFTVIAALACTFNVFAQCTPGSPTGAPGLSPAPASVPCIERGVFYDFTLQFENFSGFSCSGFNVDISSASITSLANLPCGITWQADQSSYGPGETGCIRISGTTTDPVGEYALTVSMTFNLDILGSNYPVSGTIAQLQSQLNQFGCSAPPVNTNYFSRVIDPGNSCPAIGGSPGQTSSGTTCPPPSTPTVTVSGGAAICAGDSVTLTANVTNGTGTVTYAWNPGGGATPSITVNPTSTTTYTVTVTATNGTATGSATVTVNPDPTAAFTATPSGMSASVSNTSTNANSYSWDFGDGGQSTTQNPAPHNYSNNGTYTITLIATNACGSDTTTQQVTINSGTGLSVTVSGGSTICAGDPATLTANVSNSTGTVTYSWSPGGSATQSITVNPTTTTTYTVTVTDQNGSTTGSATVTVNPLPNAAFTANASGTTATITNTTTNATSYSWNFGDGDVSTAQNPGTHTYPGNGTFTITLIATNSCGSDTATQQVTTTSTGGPSVIISGNTNVCSAASTTLSANVTNASGTVTYAWSTGGTAQTSTVNPTATTVYQVTITAQNGVASASVTVTVNDGPDANFTATVSGPTATLDNNTTGATSFAWNFADSNVSALQEPLYHNYTSNGVFTITLVATNGCGSDTATQSVTIVGVGIHDVATDMAIMKVYPNPFNESATVEVENITGSFDAALYTITGLKVYQRRDIAEGKFVLQKDALPQGVYLLELSNEKVLKRVRVVIN